MAQNAFGMSGAPSQAGTSSAGQSFISTLVARMPYNYRMLQNALDSNPKYDTFNKLITRREERIYKQSITQTQPEQAGNIVIDKRYTQLMYADIDVDKTRRLQDYRKMASYAELAECVDEIADEAIVRDQNGDIIKLFLRGEHDKIVEDMIEKEWKKFIQVFQLEENGWEYIRHFLIDGEIYFENIISENRPDYGILGVVKIPTELINPIYSNPQNHIINGFLLRKPVLTPQKAITNQTHEELIPLEKNQVTYIHSGLWNEDCTIRLPYIENSRRAYKQLSLVEDSIVIYRLVRAPERLVFHVDVGNMPVPKAEEYVKRLMQQFWGRKNFDSSQNRVMNVYDPQSMLDAFWFTKRGQNEGTSVTSLPGGASLGQLEDLMYFVKKLYKSLRVPQTRLDPADPFKDGTEITREELRFARFIIRIQQQIAQGIKNSFITHLKLRGKKKESDDKNNLSVWEKFKLREHQLVVQFNMPTSFAVMREQQIFDIKKNNYTGLITDNLISHTFCQKYYLGLTDRQMAENREWLRKDAALSWEIQQIASTGPNFRKLLSAQAEMEKMITDDSGPVASGEGTALPAGEGMPPDFGVAPETGGGQATSGASTAPAGEGTALPAGGEKTPAST